MKFDLGSLVATKTIAGKMSKDVEFGKFVVDALRKYAKGDWGDISDEDRLKNDEAIKNGDRIFARYYKDGDKSREIWILTERDRRVTAVSSPSGR